MSTTRARAGTDPTPTLSLSSTHPAPAGHVLFRTPSPLRKELTLDSNPDREWRRSIYAPPTPYPPGMVKHERDGSPKKEGFVDGLRRRASSLKSVVSRHSRNSSRDS